MDNKRTLLAMVVVIAIVMIYPAFLTRYVYPHHPEWFKTADSGQVAPTTQSTASTQAATTSTAPSSGMTSMSPATLPTSTLRLAAVNTSDQQLNIGSIQPEDPNFALGLDISPTGAGLRSAVINQARAVDSKHPYSFQTPYAMREDLLAFGDNSLTINGQNINLNVPWKIESSSPTDVTFGVNIVTGADAQVLHLTKTFALEHRSKENTAGGYEINLTYHLVNQTAAEQTASLDFNGPTMPPRELERGDDRQVVIGYDKDKSIDIVRKGLSDFKPGADDFDVYTSDKGNKQLWAGDISSYFGAIVRPASADQFKSVHVKALNSAALPEDRAVVMEFRTADLKLAPGASVDVSLKVFLGPKERGLLENDYYGEYPRDYQQLLSASSSMCSFCAVPKLVDFLVYLLNFFHMVLLGDWGLAIIALVVIVRLLLHPITKSSQVSMLKMQKMGPELERLKKKYGDDKEAFAKAQMEFYKEMGISPFLGCLPMFLQMPIWIALYSALQNEYKLRQASFLMFFGHHLTWITDLSRPDRLITWDSHPFTLPLLGPITALNILPLLIAVVMYIQQKTQPQPPTMTPEQQSQRKMMMWMSFLWPFFLYTAPSGLNLYIMTSTTIGIIESKRIRDHIKQRQDAEKAGAVIVDAPEIPKDQRRANSDLKKKQSENAGGVLGLWGNLQRKLEEIIQESDRKKKDKRN